MIIHAFLLNPTRMKRERERDENNNKPPVIASQVYVCVGEWESEPGWLGCGVWGGEPMEKRPWLASLKAIITPCEKSRQKIHHKFL